MCVSAHVTIFATPVSVYESYLPTSCFIVVNSIFHALQEYHHGLNWFALLQSQKSVETRSIIPKRMFYMLFPCFNSCFFVETSKSSNFSTIYCIKYILETFHLPGFFEINFPIQICTSAWFPRLLCGFSVICVISLVFSSHSISFHLISSFSPMFPTFHSSFSKFFHVFMLFPHVFPMFSHVTFGICWHVSLVSYPIPHDVHYALACAESIAHHGISTCTLLHHHPGVQSEHASLAFFILRFSIFPCFSMFFHVFPRPHTSLSESADMSVQCPTPSHRV